MKRGRASKRTCLSLRSTVKNDADELKNGRKEKSPYMISHFFHKNYKKDPCMDDDDDDDDEEEAGPSTSFAKDGRPSTENLPKPPTPQFCDLLSQPSRTPRPKLNDSDLGDFQTPKQFHARAVFSSKPAVKTKKNGKKTQTKTKKKNSKVRVDERIDTLLMRSNRNKDVNEDHLQLAIGLSKSTHEIENPGVDIEPDEQLYYPNTQERLACVRKTLEQFGFKSNRNGGKGYEVRIPVEQSKRKKPLFKTIPILYQRTPKDRNNISHRQIENILDETSRRTVPLESYYDSFETAICGDVLESYYSHEAPLFSKSGQNLRQISDKSFFYTGSLIPPSTTHKGALLRDWNCILGRERTPPRDIEIMPKTQTKNDEKVLEVEKGSSDTSMELLELDLNGDYAKQTNRIDSDKRESANEADIETEIFPEVHPDDFFQNYNIEVSEDFEKCRNTNEGSRKNADVIEESVIVIDSDSDSESQCSISSSDKKETELRSSKRNKETDWAEQTIRDDRESSTERKFEIKDGSALTEDEEGSCFESISYDLKRKRTKFGPEDHQKKPKLVIGEDENKSEFEEVVSRISDVSSVVKVPGIVCEDEKDVVATMGVSGRRCSSRTRGRNFDESVLASSVGSTDCLEKNVRSLGTQECLTMKSERRVRRNMDRSCKISSVKAVDGLEKSSRFLNLNRDNLEKVSLEVEDPNSIENDSTIVSNKSTRSKLERVENSSDTKISRRDQNLPVLDVSSDPKYTIENVKSVEQNCEILESVNSKVLRNPSSEDLYKPVVTIEPNRKTEVSDAKDHGSGSRGPEPNFQKPVKRFKFVKPKSQPTERPNTGSEDRTMDVRLSASLESSREPRISEPGGMEMSRDPITISGRRTRARKSMERTELTVMSRLDETRTRIGRNRDKTLEFPDMCRSNNQKRCLERSELKKRQIGGTEFDFETHLSMPDRLNGTQRTSKGNGDEIFNFFGLNRSNNRKERLEEVIGQSELLENQSGVVRSDLDTDLSVSKRSGAIQKVGDDTNEILDFRDLPKTKNLSNCSEKSLIGSQLKKDRLGGIEYESRTDLDGMERSTRDKISNITDHLELKNQKISPYKTLVRPESGKVRSGDVKFNSGIKLSILNRLDGIPATMRNDENEKSDLTDLSNSQNEKRRLRKSAESSDLTQDQSCGIKRVLGTDLFASGRSDENLTGSKNQTGVRKKSIELDLSISQLDEVRSDLETDAVELDETVVAINGSKYMILDRSDLPKPKNEKDQPSSLPKCKLDEIGFDFGTSSVGSDRTVISAKVGRYEILDCSNLLDPRNQKGCPRGRVSGAKFDLSALDETQRAMDDVKNNISTSKTRNVSSSPSRYSSCGILEVDESSLMARSRSITPDMFSDSDDEMNSGVKRTAEEDMIGDSKRSGVNQKGIGDKSGKNDEVASAIDTLGHSLDLSREVSADGDSRGMSNREKISGVVPNVNDRDDEIRAKSPDLPTSSPKSDRHHPEDVLDLTQSPDKSTTEPFLCDLTRSSCSSRRRGSISSTGSTIRIDQHVDPITPEKDSAAVPDRSLTETVLLSETNAARPSIGSRTSDMEFRHEPNSNDDDDIIVLDEIRSMSPHVDNSRDSFDLPDIGFGPFTQKNVEARATDLVSLKLKYFGNPDGGISTSTFHKCKSFVESLNGFDPNSKSKSFTNEIGRGSTVGAENRPKSFSNYLDVAYLSTEPVSGSKKKLSFDDIVTGSPARSKDGVPEDLTISPEKNSGYESSRSSGMENSQESRFDGQSDNESVCISDDDELNYSCSTPYRKPDNTKFLKLLDFNMSAVEDRRDDENGSGRKQNVSRTSTSPRIRSGVRNESKDGPNPTDSDSDSDPDDRAIYDYDHFYMEYDDRAYDPCGSSKNTSMRAEAAKDVPVENFSFLLNSPLVSNYSTPKSSAVREEPRGVGLSKHVSDIVCTPRRSNVLRRTASEKSGSIGGTTTTTGNRTPECVFVSKVNDVTPMADFERMDTPMMHKELKKYGLKPLKRTRGIQLLRYIYEQTHPEMDNVDDLKHTSKCKKMHACTDVSHERLRVQCETAPKVVETTRRKSATNRTDRFVPAPPCRIHIVGDVQSKNDTADYLIFERTQSKKISTCRLPFHIAWHNYVSERPEIRLQILQYQPLQVEPIHADFKQMGFKFHLNDIISFLDRRCITIRTNQHSHHRRNVRPWKKTRR